MTSTRKPTVDELATAAFRKSTHSGGGGNECVEVAELGPWTCVRDSKDTARPGLTVRAESFAALIAGIRGA